ncbi:MAG: hypothetical protein E6Q67_03210 [Roseateles sp.]|nr:MAG: hypothetical protein E6Q67_03210 [Roseateles sp.]
MGVRIQSLSMERVLAAYLRARRVKLLADGQPQAAILMLSPEALLPVIAMHAEMAAKELFGKDATLGVQYRQDEAAMFGVYAKVPPIQSDMQGVMRALMFVYATNKVFQIKPGEHIECQPIYDHYRNGSLAGMLDNPDARVEWPLATAAALQH